ncbi:MAG TPA: glutamate formimidoyltransferase [Bacteroidales bacterium]|nr:glutamate formimidoyltransferase [Bacteroidales bacterium]
MEKRIVECVPNFSEGRDMVIIKHITDVIESVDGVSLLNIDPGKDTNRTVVTFVGDPEAVSLAAFLAVKKASELIDMSKHRGKHPRMGATDVLPFIPVSGITMEETVTIARKVAESIGNELGIPVYCYENAAFSEGRRNLANCRSGEYEGLLKKFADPEWKPDFGPVTHNARSGATAVGARDFLIAYNVNLNTTSVRRANAVAFDVREKGRTILNENGENIVVPGSLKSVKAIGWFIKEYGIAQISMNLTNISITPLHIAFDEVCKRADARGIRVTGSEIVGLIPLKSLLEAGRFFLEKQGRSTGVSDDELITIAIRSLGLNDIKSFNPNEKVIEYVMKKNENMEQLIDLNLRQYINLTASEAPVPGGGSASAYMGALGVALGTMVANLSSHKKGWDERWKEFSEWAEKGKKIQNELLQLVDEDTNAYKEILTAYSLPKATEEEKEVRKTAITKATKLATLVPFKVMQTAFSGYEVISEMIEKGNPNSVTDAGVGALAIRSCIKGAFLNVKVNLAGLTDKEFVEKILIDGEAIDKRSELIESEMLMRLKVRLTQKG